MNTVQKIGCVGLLRRKIIRRQHYEKQIKTVLSKR